MPESEKAARLARKDKTIERPARKISMIDGYAEEEKREEAAAPAQENSGTESAQGSGSAAGAVQEAPQAEEKQDEQ